MTVLSFGAGMLVGGLTVGLFIPAVQLAAYCRGRRDQRIEWRAAAARGRA